MPGCRHCCVSGRNVLSEGANTTPIWRISVHHGSAQSWGQLGGEMNSRDKISL